MLRDNTNMLSNQAAGEIYAWTTQRLQIHTVEHAEAQTHTCSVNSHSACKQRLACYRRTKVFPLLAAWHPPRQTQVQESIFLKSFLSIPLSIFPFSPCCQRHHLREYTSGGKAEWTWNSWTSVRQNAATTLFELEFTQGYVYLSPPFFSNCVGE